MATILYWQDEDTGQTESVQFDAVQSENPEDSLNITEHPVEEGANIADHARKVPTQLSIEGFVSTIPNLAIDDDAVLDLVTLNVPSIVDPGTKTIHLDVPPAPVGLSPSGLLQAGVSAIGNLITGGPNYNATVQGDLLRTTRSVTAQALRTERNRVRDVYDLLLKAQEQKLLITVSTRFRDYFDMMLERVAAPRSVDDGSKVLFQCDLKQIRIAASETVQSPQPAEVRGQLPQNKGSQAAKPAEQPEKPRSLLRSGILAFFGGE